MLQEVWRVSRPARMLVVVPNRLGVCGHAHGQPVCLWKTIHPFAIATFSGGKRFHAAAIYGSTFFVPYQSPWLMRIMHVVEAIGRRLFLGFGGVLIVEAEKQIYAKIAERVATRPRRLYAPATAQPAMRTILR